MKLFNFTVNNCRNCNKCVRVCPVKAIRFINNVAEIDETRCIACGHCFDACPQHARNMQNDVDRVLDYIDKGKKVIALLDSAYIGTFKDPSRFVSALRKLGFASVRDTATASEKTTALYIDYIKENAGKQRYFISSTCPSSYIFIQKYHKELVPFLIPIASPLVIMGREAIKEDPDCIPVYIGPCLSKKYETSFDDKEVKAHITLVEVLKMFRRRNINMAELEPSVPDVFPMESGETYSTAGDMWPEITKTVEDNGYDVLRVCGIENIKELFKSMENQTLEKCYIGIAACQEACINGPFIPWDSNGLFCRRQKIKSFAEKGGWNGTSNKPDWEDIEFRYEFEHIKVPDNKPDEEEIRKILIKMGREKKTDELDCGACGYNTCREKAIAVYEGMADIEMCWPNLQDKARKKGDMFFQHSINILMLLDKDLNIIEINPVAEKKFGVLSKDVSGKNIAELGVCTEIFKKASQTHEDILNVKMQIAERAMTVITNIICIEGEEIFVLMQDVTLEEERKAEIAKLKHHTVNTAQNIIEKQMRVAQEIASLLGETTAETKVVLNRLKDVVLKEEGE